MKGYCCEETRKGNKKHSHTNIAANIFIPKCNAKNLFAVVAYLLAPGLWARRILIHLNPQIIIS
jgi:hypothetical protein